MVVKTKQKKKQPPLSKAEKFALRVPIGYCLFGCCIFFKLRYLFIYLFIYLSMYLLYVWSQQRCGSQMTACGSQLSPSSTGTQGLVAGQRTLRFNSCRSDGVCETLAFATKPGSLAE